MSHDNPDNDLIRRDHRLIGLPVILDPNALNRHLAAVSDQSPCVLDRQYIRYKPATNCLVKYHSGAESDFPSFYAKAYAGEFVEKFAKDRHRVAQGWAPEARLWALPEHRVLVRQFPQDGRLRSLSVLANLETQTRLLRRLFPNQTDTKTANLRTLAYKPERRYVAKLSGTGAETSVLKFYGFQSFTRSLSNLHYLRKVGFSLLPPLLGKSRRRQVLALGWRPGQTLRELLTSHISRSETAVSVGNALATLHRLPAGKGLTSWSLQRETKRLQALVDTLAFLVPDCSTQTQRLCDDICQQLTRVPMPSQVIHGDFHSKQVLVDHGNVHFLDPDELAVGPAQLDVGTFIAHLYRDGLGGRIPLASVSQTVDAFLHGYQALGGWTESVSVFTALALLKFSHHPFRACEDNWDERIEQIVQLAGQFVSQGAVVGKKVRAI